MNPERADIIIPGAAILDTFMKELALDAITVTGRGLQDGLLVDYCSRMDAFPLLGELPRGSAACCNWEDPAGSMKSMPGPYKPRAGIV